MYIYTIKLIAKISTRSVKETIEFWMSKWNERPLSYVVFTKISIWKVCIAHICIVHKYFFANNLDFFKPNNNRKKKKNRIKWMKISVWSNKIILNRSWIGSEQCCSSRESRSSPAVCDTSITKSDVKYFKSKVQFVYTLRHLWQDI